LSKIKNRNIIIYIY